EEHEVEHLALAGGQRPERAPDPGSLLPGGERVRRLGVRSEEELPGRPRFQPSAAPRPGGHVPHHREEPGLEGGAAVEPGAAFQDREGHGLENLLCLGGVPARAGQGPGEARRMERSDPLLEFGRCHASGPWRTLAQGFAERARGWIALGSDAAIRGDSLRVHPAEGRVPAFGDPRTLSGIAAGQLHIPASRAAGMPPPAPPPRLSGSPARWARASKISEPEPSASIVETISAVVLGSEPACTPPRATRTWRPAGTTPHPATTCPCPGAATGSRRCATSRSSAKVPSLGPPRGAPVDAPWRHGSSSPHGP